MSGSVPDRAQVVIIGGGVIGTSVAYHLTKLGWTDVVLVEQGQLSSGTTWHAAGLVGQLRASESGTRLVQYSTELYADLESEVGLSTGYKRCGGVTVARSEERMTQLRRTAATAEAFDLECELLTPDEAAGSLPDHAGRGPGGRDLAAGGRQGQPDRPDQRPGQGGPAARRARDRAHAGAGRAHRRRPGGRGLDRRRRHRGRGGRELRGPMGQAGRRAGRCQRSPALRRAFLRGHRALRGRAHRPAHPSGPGRLHLLQGGGRGTRRRRLRTRGEAVGGPGPAAVPVRVPAARGGLGALQHPDGERAAADPGAGGDRDPQVLQRAGELHPRQPVHPGRGTRGAEPLRRRRLQLGRHRLAPVVLGAPWPSGSSTVKPRPTSPPSTSAGSRRSRQQPVVARPRGRGARPPLRGALAQPGDEDRQTLPPVAGVPPAGAGKRQLRQSDGLGAGQLLRSGRRGARDRVLVVQAELAALVGRRAGEHARAGHRLRPDLLLEVPAGRAGRRGGAAVDLHGRRGRAARDGRCTPGS